MYATRGFVVSTLSCTKKPNAQCRERWRGGSGHDDSVSGSANGDCNDNDNDKGSKGGEEGEDDGGN